MDEIKSRSMVRVDVSTGTRQNTRAPRASLSSHIKAVTMLNATASDYGQVYLLTDADHAEITDKLNTVPRRMWVDQPSTRQPLHILHGTNVLAMPDTTDTMRIYFLSGEVVSQQAPANALSPGWC